ncbi:type II toxin-antitoxin system HigA family antitoxin [Casimicrobium huifangae]|jgi:HTH-type transcriptional regulator/antitoxin HigA|uniref:type II toxin-antitoxin system HigA family antitoxin n=1 Tax=Casimicrobium huifangae TaxID=2591109 RepID=UPI003784D86A
MDIRPIRTKADYKAALALASKLVDKDPKAGTPDGDRLDVLATLIQAYEALHYPIPAPDPIECLLHVMEARAMTRKDLEPYIGSRGRVSEILNRTRPLSLTMIRNLHAALGIPAEILVREYAATAA